MAKKKETSWEERYDKQRKLAYPFIWPLLKAADLDRHIDKRAFYKLTTAANPLALERKQKIIFYIRIYTTIMTAQHFAETGNSSKSRNFLRIALKRTASDTVPHEDATRARLHRICAELIAILRTFDPASSAGALNHLKTKMQLAQNICILRLLRI